MWIVAKYNVNELKIMKDNFIKLLGETVEFYKPKIRYQKYVKKNLKTFEKCVLEGYVICKHTKFKDLIVLDQLKYTKGRKYFLNGHCKNQKEIIEFVEKCKAQEDEDGYLKQGFFESSINTRAKFISGPFTNMIFNIISKQNNKLIIRIGNITTTISNRVNYQYRTA